MEFGQILQEARSSQSSIELSTDDQEYSGNTGATWTNHSPTAARMDESSMSNLSDVFPLADNSSMSDSMGGGDEEQEHSGNPGVTWTNDNPMVGGGGANESDDDAAQEINDTEEARPHTDNQAETRQVDITKDATWFANQMAKIGVQCDVSQEAMDKMLKLFLHNLPEIHGLYTRKEITDNYRHGVKKKAKYDIPAMRCAVKVRKPGETADEAVYITNLTVIPKKYTEQKVTDRYVLLRQEAYTTLSEIKKHYTRCHPGLTPEERTRNMSEATLSIDGVRESKHGSRTLIIISLMFGGDIMLWKVLNPLKKTKGGKPTVEELLR